MKRVAPDYRPRAPEVPPQHLSGSVCPTTDPPPAASTCRSLSQLLQPLRRVMTASPQGSRSCKNPADCHSIDGKPGSTSDVWQNSLPETFAATSGGNHTLFG